MAQKIYVISGCPSTGKTETKKEQEKIHKTTTKMHKELGYNLIIVPFMKIEERAEPILLKIKNLGRYDG